jgi:xanthine dehydrogenase accessory factor
MIHEVKLLFETAQKWQDQNYKMVLATVVALEGSSYRRPGVRMLINNEGEAVGAVSGGCVEKEVHRQAASVLVSSTPKMMQYDGRVRLGCEGILYVLIEPFSPHSDLFSLFDRAWKARKPVEIKSRFMKTVGENTGLGSSLCFENSSLPFGTPLDRKTTETLDVFEQTLLPAQQLYIFGAEHDAVALCDTANQLGWQVSVVAAPDEQKTIAFFPGCQQLLTPLPDQFSTQDIDPQTAVVLMSHSFTKDLQYLIALKDSCPAYLGLLGPAHRRARLLSEFLERFPETDPGFLDLCYGPAGLHIGAESAQEIAVSIMGEILSVMRQSNPLSLRQKAGRIHE